jgi:hypothetical protein
MSIFKSFAVVDFTDVWPQTSVVDVIIQLFSVYNKSLTSLGVCL